MRVLDWLKTNILLTFKPIVNDCYAVQFGISMFQVKPVNGNWPAVGSRKCIDKRKIFTNLSCFVVFFKCKVSRHTNLRQWKEDLCWNAKYGNRKNMMKDKYGIKRQIILWKLHTCGGSPSTGALLNTHTLKIFLKKILLDCTKGIHSLEEDTSSERYIPLSCKICGMCPEHKDF